MKPTHGFGFEAASSGAWSMIDEDEEDFLSLESLKRASATLDLHESASCSLLLPCGLLPEELAELEGSALASTLHVEAALKSITVSSQDDGPAAPLTPGKEESPLRLSALAVDTPPAASAAAGASASGRKAGGDAEAGVSVEDAVESAVPPSTAAS